MSITHIEDRLMTTDEVCEYLQIPRATMYAWRSVDNGPRAFSLGKHLHFRRSEVDAWLETQAAAWRRARASPWASTGTSP